MKISIVLIRSSSLISRLIRASMTLWCIVRFIKPTKTYSHCEVKFGQLVSGAIDEGIKTRVFTTYLNTLKDYEFKMYYLNLTEDEWIKGNDYLTEVENTPYEYTNFIYHIIKIFYGKWEGNKDKKKLYCFEHGARFLNATGKYNVDLFLNPYEFKAWCDKNLV